MIPKKDGLVSVFYPWLFCLHQISYCKFMANFWVLLEGNFGEWARPVAGGQPTNYHCYFFKACCSLHWPIIIDMSCHIFLVIYLIIGIFYNVISLVEMYSSFIQFMVLLKGTLLSILEYIVALYISFTNYLFIYLLKWNLRRWKFFSGCVGRKLLSKRLEPITDLCHLSMYFVGI